MGKIDGEIVEKLSHFAKQLESGDSLACVVVSTSFLDAALSQLLQKTLINGDTSKALLHHDKGPLGTLSAKASVAYCMGLITKTCFSNLKKIGEIRNLFAHLVDDLTFESLDVRNKCMELILPPLHTGNIDETAFAIFEDENDPRMRFCRTSVTAFSYLRFMTSRQKQPARPEDDKGFPHFAFFDN